MNPFRYITKKTFIFGIAGTIGALIGAIIAEPIQLLRDDINYLFVIISIMSWAGLVGSGIAIALIYTQNKFLQKNINFKQILKVGLGGLIIGAVAGFIAQILFSINPTETIRVFAWGLFGMLLGIGTAKFVPNYPKVRAAIAGLVGGVLGAIIFIILTIVFYQTFARFAGASIIGFFIGLMISLFEELFREAWLIVEWNAKEKTHISLGETPIVIGSSPDAHIYLSGFPPVAATIRLEKGEVKFEDKSKNKISTLKNDSKIQLGSINILIKAK